MRREPVEKCRVKAKKVKYVSRPHHLFIPVGGLFPFASRVIKTIGSQIVCQLLSWIFSIQTTQLQVCVLPSVKHI